MSHIRRSTMRSPMLFPVEIIDEGEDEVLIFDSPEILAEFEFTEETGEPFDDSRVRRRTIELLDQLNSIAGELGTILAA